MPTISAVLTLTSEPEERHAVIKELSEHAEVTLGKLVGDRLPVVVQTDSQLGDAEFWKHVRRTVGILHIEVVFAELGN